MDPPSRWGTRLHPGWRVRLTGPRFYRHPCGAAVRLEWDYVPGKGEGAGGGTLSIRWKGSYLERRIEVPARKQGEDWTQSHRKSRLIYEATEEMLGQLDRPQKALRKVRA